MVTQSNKHRIKKGLLTFFLAHLAATLTGCGTKGIEIIDAYDTARFTKEQVAILYVADDLAVWEIDGVDTNMRYLGYSGSAIRIGPGDHVAKVHYSGYKGKTVARKSFTLPSSGTYFIAPTVLSKDGNSYIQLHVHECGSEEALKLKQAHDEKSYRKYKNGCPENLD